MDIKILTQMQLQQEKLEIWEVLVEEDNQLVWVFSSQQDKFWTILKCVKFWVSKKVWLENNSVSKVSEMLVIGLQNSSSKLELN